MQNTTLEFIVHIARQIREDNIRMDVTEIVREAVDWIHLVQDGEQWWALVNVEMNLRVQ
jgi:hypothetical protein